jgi:succinyl-CoA synthetase beta subunit
MRLYEFEGKRILESAGLAVPKGAVIDSPSKVSDTPAHSCPTVVKAQVLWGKRSKAGGILSCADAKAAEEAVAKELGLKIHGEVVKRVLIEERLETARECYIGITYQDRAPCVIACSEGGVDIEEVRNIHPERVAVQPVSIVHGLTDEMAVDILTRAGFGNDVGAVVPILLRVYGFFISNDALLVEINPLIKTRDGKWYAADAKIEIDDEAAYRSHVSLPERLGSGKEPTRLEVLARENDLIDSRGAAGRMFYEIEGGSIVIIAAGGGTSMEALDDLYSLGGRPAIFTEHSGNPTGEKVSGLVRIALMYPGEIDAIWVIGGRANFTDIYETLVNGVMAGIRETPNFDRSVPIIVRRAGPRDEEAYQALRKAREEEGYNIYLRGMATSIADSARMVIYQANKHYTARKRAAQL